VCKTDDLHSAKGSSSRWCSWPAWRRVCSAQDELEEPGRLEEEAAPGLWWALTRAMQQLVITWANPAACTAAETFNRYSRFVREIPLRADPLKSRYGLIRSAVPWPGQSRQVQPCSRSDATKAPVLPWASRVMHGLFGEGVVGGSTDGRAGAAQARVVVI